MNKRFIIFLVAAIVILGATFLLDLNRDKAATNNKAASQVNGNIAQPKTQDFNSNSVAAKASYTMTEVAMHNSVSDCWMVIDNQVFNVTSFIVSHPGGNEILASCGQDATILYETRPTGSGTPHSDAARAIKGTYYIGELE